MIATLRIDPHNLKSAGAKELSKATGILRVTPNQVRKHGDFNTIINWGSSERRFEHARYINDPEAVAIASNKLSTARRFGECGVPQPTYTTNKEVAEAWYNSGTSVLARRLLRGSQARGLTLHIPRQDDIDTDTDIDTDESHDGYVGVYDGGNASAGGEHNSNGDNRPVRGGIVEAPMYTKYVKKQDEYRVHVFDGEVIDVQQKKKRQLVPNEDVNYQIRNSANGWVYCRDAVVVPDCVRTAAVAACAALGLDFGAADVGYNCAGQSAVVYEVNTAPGLEGTTLERYNRAIQQFLPVTQGGSYARRRAA